MRDRSRAPGADPALRWHTDHCPFHCQVDWRSPRPTDGEADEGGVVTFVYCLVTLPSPLPGGGRSVREANREGLTANFNHPTPPAFAPRPSTERPSPSSGR